MNTGADAEPLWKQLARRDARAGNTCPQCLGLEWVRVERAISHPQYGQLERCPVCTKGRLSAYLQNASGLTGWLLNASFTGYIQADTRRGQFEAAQQIAKRATGWLVLWGGYGQGKTYLLASIVNQAISNRRPAVYVTASRLLDHLREAYRPDGMGWSAAFDNWAQCAILCIDEIDAYKRTEWAEEKWRQLLDVRYNLSGETATVFACNSRPGGDSWPADLGWLYSRMRQFSIVETGGGDVRPMLKEL